MRVRTLLWSIFVVGALLPCLGCSSSSATTTATGGPVTGAADDHCSAPTMIAQPIDPAACQPTPGSDAGVDDATSDAMSGMEMGEPRYGVEADDDDCKYHVKWSANAIRQGADATFTVTLTEKATGAPATGAEPDAEVFLNATHPAPNSGQTTRETTPGSYAIGPIRFDASGRWTVRFHFHETCSDLLPSSPHGHVAFYVDVP